MRDGNVNTAMCTWRLTPLSLYLHTAARHFLKSLLLNPSSIHRKKTQNSISFTKARPIHKGWIPNVIYPQYRTSRWNRSSRKPSPENPFCVLYEGFDIKCHLWTWRTRTIVQALAHSLSPSLSPSDCQTHRENSLLLWRFQYFQNCSTDAAEVLYQEFWSVWLFTSPHKPCVIRATLQAQAFYHLSRKQLENFFTKFQYIQDDEILLKPRQQHSQHIQNHKELWWKVTLSPSCMLKFPATGFLVVINPA